MILRQIYGKLLDCLPGFLANLLRKVVYLGKLFLHATGISTLVKNIENTRVVHTAFFSDKRIDLVEIDGFFLFSYMDDFFYNRVIDEENKFKTTVDIIERKNQIATIKRDVNDFFESWIPPKDADNFLLGQFISHYREFNLIDVGCLYGRTTMNYARFAEQYGATPNIFSFDAGMAGNLTKYNLVNNGFYNVQFYPLAIGQYDGYSPFYMEYGVSENNRLINKLNTPKSITRIVESTQLDTFLTRNNSILPSFIKIDTQGAELEVFTGMQNLIREQVVAGVMEYFPSGLKSRVVPGEFIQHLAEEFVLLDLGPARDKVESVDIGNISKFTGKIKSSHHPWTDLLFISKKFPNLEYILSKLLKVPDSIEK